MPRLQHGFTSTFDCQQTSLEVKIRSSLRGMSILGLFFDLAGSHLRETNRDLQVTDESSPEPDDGVEGAEGFASGSDLTGKLLVASPRLSDPSFNRAVVIVLDHGPIGALGLVLNRPTEVPVDEILAHWHELAAKTLPAVIFAGGPVSPGAVIGLVRGRHDVEPAGWHSVLGEVGTVDLSIAPDDQPPGLEGVRLFSGYAGWSASQLDDEVEEGAWFLIDPTESDLLTDSPDTLWHDVLKRQGGDLGLLANFPPHPSVN